MSAIWVVAADASRARIFSADKPASPLTEVEAFAHPAARLHQADLLGEDPHDHNSGHGNHDRVQENDIKEEEAIRFAAQVCDTLEQARQTGRFSRLHVIASPAFLGLLRKQHTASVKKLIGEEIAKNLTTQPPETIRKALPEFL